LPGDIVVIVTDGVTEARNALQEEFGETRLLSLVSESGGLRAPDLREKIVEEVCSFCRGVEPHDDVTVVVLKVRDGRGVVGEVAP
jgi:serine phosphatase RsbU (regulator of sigma subunit)